MQRTVIEDDSVRIEELRVRGLNTSLVVKPKHAAVYEVVPAPGGRDPSQGRGGSQGAGRPARLERAQVLTRTSLMAVFTEVSVDEASAFVARLDIGTLTGFRGIQAGIENSNFFVDTERSGVTRHWVLTIFERLTFEQLPFYLHLMRHLARRGIPVPEPQADRGGAILHALKGRPAALVDKLDGGHQLAPDVDHCAPGRRDARAHASGRPGLPAVAAQPARPGLVDRDGAAGATLSRRRPARPDRRRTRVPAAARRVAGPCQPAARRRSMPTCSATT